MLNTKKKELQLGLLLYFCLLQAIIGILRKESSVIDPGTFASNAVITGNTNALKSVESENYNKIREFFTTETDAFLVSSAMVYFGMETVNDSPTKNAFSTNLHKSNVEEKRKWLYYHAEKLFDHYFSDSVTELGDTKQVNDPQEREALPCRFPGCTRVFQYSKCRDNHEKSKHSFGFPNPQQSVEARVPTDPRTPQQSDVAYSASTDHTPQQSVEIYRVPPSPLETVESSRVLTDPTDPSPLTQQLVEPSGRITVDATPQQSDPASVTMQPAPCDESVGPSSVSTGVSYVHKSDVKREDHVYNYGCLHISLGLLIRDAEDSVKEGDGERLVRVWKFLTFLFRLRGCHKYALAGLRLLASKEGLLTPRKSHQLVWNRFAGLKQGPGTRISRDERVEQLNKVCKEEIRARGFPNINDESVVTATQCTGPIDKLIRQSNEDLQRESKSGHHCNSKAMSTFTTILSQVHFKAKVFDFYPGRQYKAFPGLRRELFSELPLGPLAEWIKKHKNHWHCQNRQRYKPSLSYQ